MQQPTPANHGTDPAIPRQGPQPDRGCMIANAAAAVAAWRGSARTIRERTQQLRSAGRIHDEAWFRANAERLP